MLVDNALLDANPARRRAMLPSHGPSESQTMEQLATTQTERDLGETGGEGEPDSGDEDEEDTNTTDSEVKAKKRHIRAGSRNAALLLIVCYLPTIHWQLQTTNRKGFRNIDSQNTAVTLSGVIAKHAGVPTQPH